MNRRVKLTISYNGASFQGLQTQTSTENTILGTLRRILKRLNIDAKPVASGRTDSGVHAFRQVIHLDLPAHWYSLERLARALEHQLPLSIRVRRLEWAEPDFHARYSAKRRVYRYILTDKTPNPFEADLVTFVPSLSLERINETMHCFEGEHDFANFMKTGSDVTSTVRVMFKAFAYRHKAYTVLYFEANGFLRSQIRMMAAAVLKVNDGSLTIRQIEEQLALENRLCTDLAPAAGLYLSKITY